MPRTKSGKNFNPSIMDEYNKIDDKFKKGIFFNYYLGFKSNGAEGYDVKEVDGSAAHWSGIGEVYTKQQFRGIGRKMAKLAKRFLETKDHQSGFELVPPMEERPTFTAEEINAVKESRVDRRAPMEKYNDELKNKDWEDYFIFFKYYDGYKTDGDIGFSPHHGACGSVNHKRSYNKLNHMTEWKFRTRGVILGPLAKEVFENNIAPPEDDRPEFEDEPLTDMIIAHDAMIQNASPYAGEEEEEKDEEIGEEEDDEPEVMVLDDSDDDGNDYSYCDDNKGDIGNTGGYQYAWM